MLTQQQRINRGLLLGFVSISVRSLLSESFIHILVSTFIHSFYIATLNPIQGRWNHSYHQTRGAVNQSITGSTQRQTSMCAHAHVQGQVKID